MKQSLRLGTISGIPVGLHWGLVLIAALYLFSLATGLLPAAAPGFGTGAYWVAATIGVVAFFASILLHELGHSLVAQRSGIGVRSITLWLLGGVAELESEARNARTEFAIAVAGPAVSVALAVGFGIAYALVDPSSLVGATAGYLAFVNGALALFNLIPAAPLDGGRILSAALWARHGDPHRARASAATVGRVFGLTLVAVGAVQFFTGGPGLWLVVMGLFLHAAAQAERERAQVLGAASTMAVGSAMVPLTRPVIGGVTVAGLLTMGAPEGGHAVPVIGPEGAVSGIVPGSLLGSISPARLDTTTLDEIMVPWSEFVSARADESARRVIDRMHELGRAHTLVYDHWGNQVGYFGFGDLGRLRTAATV